jgi:hypothetical protein
VGLIILDGGGSGGWRQKTAAMVTMRMMKNSENSGNSERSGR